MLGNYAVTQKILSYYMFKDQRGSENSRTKLFISKNLDFFVILNQNCVS